MNLYSVLLVDDEEEVFQVIMKKLDWESMGFCIAGYARNGVEALEMAEELQVDVVMTDIKMPYMDGLTFCRKLKELYPKTKIIIFSGFDEFDYAREAIKVEAEEYILKPIDSNELREIFERIKVNLDKELDEKRNIDKLREYYLESLPMLQENFLISLMDGRIAEDQIEKYAADYQIDLKGPYYVVTILHISTASDGEDAQIDPFLKAIAVKKLAEEQLLGAWDSKIFMYLGDILVITQLCDEDSVARFTDTMDKLCRMAKRICNARVTAGIGHLCDHLCRLPKSYQGAQNAVSYRVLYGNTRAINIAETDPQENVDIPWEEPFIQKIFKEIKMGEEGSLREAVGEFAARLAVSKMSLQKYRLLLMELVTEIFRFIGNNQINADAIFGQDSDIYNQALQLESTQALKEWLEESCIRMRRQVLHERQDTTKSFVTKAIEYVKEHYGDQELSIETICGCLSVSAAYFSTVFKKETGKTFINYLTDYRMDKALELLLEKGEKTYIIAEKVGYSDPNYFSYVFKKQFGMSPSKYKADKLEQR
ncbi:MAG: response regulator [Lachnospiraceae bacterium]|nr:response regulator [Lachnospiraceae bacterium]